MHTAMQAKTAVPLMPQKPTQPVTSNGPSTKPLLPPMEKMLRPMPLLRPETLLAKRAPSGWKSAAPMPLSVMAAKMAQ